MWSLVNEASWLNKWLREYTLISGVEYLHMNVYLTIFLITREALNMNSWYKVQSRKASLSSQFKKSELKNPDRLLAEGMRRTLEVSYIASSSNHLLTQNTWWNRGNICIHLQMVGRKRNFWLINRNFPCITVLLDQSWWNSTHFSRRSASQFPPGIPSLKNW